MNLGSHIFFAGIVTALITRNPYFALLAGIGSFIPDLDRDYLFSNRKTFNEEQWHRALFHNLLFISGLFLINQWLAFGAFLHSFLDSFTTEKDRGVEWLFPFSRLVKRGKYALESQREGEKCKIILIDQKPLDRVCFISEDSSQMTKLSDNDLKQSKSVPWRRTYGPATNNQLFDRWIAIGSFSLFVVYSIVDFNFGISGRALLFSDRIIAPMLLLAGIVLIYIGGWFRKNRKLKRVYPILFGASGIFIIMSAVLSINQGFSYSIPINPLFVAIASAVLFLEAILVWRISIRNGKKILV